MEHKVKLPGFGKEDLQIKQRENLLFIKGTSSFGEVDRVYKLPTNSKVRAKMDKGLLTLIQEEMLETVEIEDG